MSTYAELSKLAIRERQTEEWIRSKDVAEIMMCIHALEDKVAHLSYALEMAQEALAEAKGEPT